MSGPAIAGVKKYQGSARWASLESFSSDEKTKCFALAWTFCFQVQAHEFWMYAQPFNPPANGTSELSMHVGEQFAGERLPFTQPYAPDWCATPATEVRELGAQLVEAERQLDDLFKTRRATAPTVSAMTEKVAHLQARIRASHLITHLEQTWILRPEQINIYDRLRGYSR